MTLSDKLLGDGSGKIFASGGEDGTVRLWSVNSSGKRGQQALKATLYGHDKAVSLASVAGYAFLVLFFPPICFYSAAKIFLYFFCSCYLQMLYCM